MRFKLKKAVSVLHQGGVLAYPTEAVYGLGCDPLNKEALVKILKLKQRQINKGFILVASHFSQLSPYLGSLDKIEMSPILASWPGHLTWILPANPKLSKYLTGRRKTIAVRVSDHPAIISLCNLYNGAIVSTSANLTNQPPIKNKYILLKQFNNKVDGIYFEKIGNNSQPSQIKDGLTGRIFR
jgi:L-threonylcarbamoyladenylate synthase